MQIFRERIAPLCPGSDHIFSNKPALGIFATLSVWSTVTVLWLCSVTVSYAGESASQAVNFSIKSDSTSSYQHAISVLDSQIRHHKALSEKHSTSWVRLQRLAEAQMQRGKLSGDINDFVAAEETLHKAFEVAGPGAGPFLTRAALNFTLHRLPLIESDLASAESALIVTPRSKETINSIRADVDLYQGRYEQAKKLYTQAEKLNPSTSTATRLANYHFQAGDYSQANQWLTQAEQRVVGNPEHLLAWIKLQFGIIDLSRGRLDEALAHYNESLAIFHDYWLAQEHIAEINAMQGRLMLAEQQYRQLVKDTHNPNFMIALAEVLSEYEDEESQTEAVEWMSAANNEFQQQLNAIPEMVAGHAVQHFMQTAGADVYLPLAQENYTLRPAGDSALLLIQALALSDQLPQAMELLESTLQTPFKTADLYATASVLYEANQQPTDAASYTRSANAMNPLAINDASWFKERIN